MVQTVWGLLNGIEEAVCGCGETAVAAFSLQGEASPSKVCKDDAELVSVIGENKLSPNQLHRLEERRRLTILAKQHGVREDKVPYLVRRVLKALG